MKKLTKKQLILEDYSAGHQSISELADRAHTTTSYVAAVLQGAGELSGYYDLYTKGLAPMNVYAAQLKGRLGFKTLNKAWESVGVLDNFYQQAEDERDRAAQHHALSVALTLFNRARWSGKFEQAQLFRNWLQARMIMEPERSQRPPQTARAA